MSPEDNRTPPSGHAVTYRMIKGKLVSPQESSPSPETIPVSDQPDTAGPETSSSSYRFVGNVALDESGSPIDKSKGTSPNQDANHETPQKKLEFVSSFLTDKLEAVEPEDGADRWGDSAVVEVRQDRLERADGTKIFFLSNTLISGQADTYDALSILYPNGRHTSLYFARNSSLGFWANRTNLSEAEVEADSLTAEEAFSNANFLELLDDTYKTITTAPVEPDKRYSRRPLPSSIITIEPDVRTAGSRETNRRILKVGVSELPLRGQDAALIDNRHNVYGVFDGVGEKEDSAVAARLAATIIQRSLAASSATEPLAVQRALIAAIDDAHYAIMEWSKESDAGLTTATIAKIIPGEARDTVVWASVGDSRIYIKNGRGRLTQISKDEGVGRDIFNCIGVPGSFKGVHETGVVTIKKSSEIVLVTDGITGDVDPDLLYERDLERALRQSATAQVASQELINISKKRDDKTAIVVRT